MTRYPEGRSISKIMGTIQQIKKPDKIIIIAAERDRRKRR